MTDQQQQQDAEGFAPVERLSYEQAREELMGIAYRTDFDLMNIQKMSGKSMEYRMKGTNEKVVPHVIEPSFGVERALMAVLTEALTTDTIGGTERTYLKLPVHLAPIKFAVSPLLKNKPQLVEKAREVYRQLKAKYGAVMWDDNGNIGKRYRRQDETGTPFCVTYDFDTLEDQAVTVRERDTMEQERVQIEDLQGDWDEIQKKNFDNGGLFDQLSKAGR